MFATINYTCRNCKVKYSNGIEIIPLGKSEMACMMLNIIHDGYAVINGKRVDVNEVHYCEDGVIGISDITSVEFVEGIK